MVALFVSAWIETIEDGVSSVGLIVALFVSAWIETNEEPTKHEKVP